MFLSSDFIDKNQLAREGSQSVCPVAIPALTTILDRQIKQDMTMCPEQTLEVLSGSNQRPERVSIPTFYFLQERTYLRHRTAILSSWYKAVHMSLSGSPRPSNKALASIIRLFFLDVGLKQWPSEMAFSSIW